MTDKKIKLKLLPFSVGLFTILLVAGCVLENNPKSESDSATIHSRFPHPLNPLDTNEIRMAKQILLNSGKIDTTFQFYLINLNEPPKTEMLAYKTGDVFRREAFVCVYDGAKNKTYESIIDLTSNKVISFTHIPGVTPGYFPNDSICDQLLKMDSAWLVGLQKRGIHPDSVKVSVAFAGDLGIGSPDHRELICAPKYRNKKYEELFIDGLVAYVDLTDHKVLRVLDDGGKGYYKPEDMDYFISDSARVLLPKTKPLKVSQPEGSSFLVEGFSVTSEKWSFRVGINNREGLVIYDARYNDDGNKRSIMYRGSVAEMYVPYGSPDLWHSSWNYYDAGAYRMGQCWPRLLNALNVGADVPENSTFLPAYYHDEKGNPHQVDSVIAIFEESQWPIARHGKFSKDGRNIVVKYFTMIGNYDYGFKWIFREDGQIDMKVELTGILGLKAVNRVTDIQGNEDESYNGSYFGTLVAPHVEAVNHQHFFSFRLDLDIDGMENLVEEMNTVGLPARKMNPWNNAFVTQMSLIKNEAEGQRKLNPSTNRNWMIANAKEVNHLGQLKSYMIMPGNSPSLFSLEGSGQRRMGDFLENQFWVTRYKERESFPAGDYPNSRAIKDGLPAWTGDNENLIGNDVVVWYNLGITHIPRPEEWPVMNVHQLGFSLTPFGFFGRSNTAENKHAPKRYKTLPGIMPPDVARCVSLPKR